MPAISAILITYNEQSDLPDALQSLRGVADEIVVVDSGSADRTREIARELGARVVSRPFTNFGEQKNFAAAQAAHDWVLSLDADERLSGESRESITQEAARRLADIAQSLRSRGLESHAVAQFRHTGDGAVPGATLP